MSIAGELLDTPLGRSLDCGSEAMTQLRAGDPEPHMTGGAR